MSCLWLSYIHLLCVCMCVCDFGFEHRKNILIKRNCWWIALGQSKINPYSFCIFRCLCICNKFVQKNDLLNQIPHQIPAQTAVQNQTEVLLIHFFYWWDLFPATTTKSAWYIFWLNVSLCGRCFVVFPNFLIMLCCYHSILMA